MPNTVNTVQQIKDRLESGMKQVDIASELGVSRAYVSSTKRKMKQEANVDRLDEKVKTRIDKKKVKDAKPSTRTGNAVNHSQGPQNVQPIRNSEMSMRGDEVETVGPRACNAKEINWDQATEMMGIFCTGEEIAAVLLISYDTLVLAINEAYGLNFKEWYSRGTAEAKMSLRRSQLGTALGTNYGERLLKDGSVKEVRIDPNPHSQIWMGKQVLGQREQIEVELEVEVIDKIEVVIPPAPVKEE